LSAAAKQQLKELMRTDPGRFLFQLALAWAAIAAAVIASAYLQSVWVSLIAILFVATRQNVLALLMHEQVHHRGFRSKRGDLFCDLAIAYPLLMSLASYRRVHLAHHRYFMTEKDPDYVRKSGAAWAFPQHARQLIKTLAADLIGLNALKLL
jgi:fatty acid desaturase